MSQRWRELPFGAKKEKKSVRLPAKPARTPVQVYLLTKDLKAGNLSPPASMTTGWRRVGGRDGPGGRVSRGHNTPGDLSSPHWTGKQGSRPWGSYIRTYSCTLARGWGWGLGTRGWPLRGELRVQSYSYTYCNCYYRLFSLSVVAAVTVTTCDYLLLLTSQHLQHRTSSKLLMSNSLAPIILLVIVFFFSFFVVFLLIKLFYLFHSVTKFLFLKPNFKVPMFHNPAIVTP